MKQMASPHSRECGEVRGDLARRASVARRRATFRRVMRDAPRRQRTVFAIIAFALIATVTATVANRALRTAPRDSSAPPILSPYRAAGLRMPCADRTLFSALRKLTPSADAPPTGTLLHFWRLRSAVGASDAFRGSDGAALSLADLKSIFLDDAAFRARYPGRDAWLIETPLAVSQRLDGRSGVSAREAHPGQFLATLAECGVTLDEPMTVGDGKYTVGDLLSQAEHDYLAGDPLEFLAVALAAWLPPRRGFANRLGERISFDDVVRSLVDARHGEGSCCGTHACHAVAAVLAAHRRSPVLSRQAAARAEAWLSEAARLLASSQHADGAWRFDWPDGRPCRAPVGADARWGESLIATGHHLEWLAQAQGADFPPASIERALSFVVRQLETARADDIQHSYCAWSHGARSLLLWRAAGGASRVTQANKG